MMRFRLTLAVACIGVSLAGATQHATTPTRVKPSNEFKVKNGSGETAVRSSVPPVRATGSSAKSLQDIERRTPTGSVSHSSKKTPAAALPPERNKANAKINFKASGTAKNSGLVRQSANPLSGRMKQKGQ